MNLKIKSSYILKEFLLNCLFSFAVFAFMFSLRSFLKVFEILIRGTFSPFLVAVLFLLTFITTFIYIIPLTFLYSSLALFARMSMDRELIVFSSAGINPARLIKSLLPVSIAASGFLLLFNLFLMPEASYRQRSIVQSLRFKNPLSLIQEKDITDDIPGVTIYLEKIHPDFRVENIAITQTDNGRVNFLKAEKGDIEYDRAKNILIFNLDNGSLLSHESKDSISTLNFRHYAFTVSLPSYFRHALIKPKISEMRLSELLSSGMLEERMEVHKRVIFGVTPLLFMLLGAGLGRKIKQKSKILHIGLGGVVGVLFFQLLVLGELLARRAFSPFPLWLPLLLSAAAALSIWKRKC